MFFYNQRAIMMVGAGLYCISLMVCCALVSSEALRKLVIVATLAWSTDVTITMALHRKFVLRLEHWAQSPKTSELPSAFAMYFGLDSCIIFVAVAAGLIWGAPIGYLSLFLLANAVVYTLFVGSSERIVTDLPSIVLVVILASVGIVLYPNSRILDLPEGLLLKLVLLAPLSLGAAIVLASSAAVSWLRAVEHQATLSYLFLLQDSSLTLSKPLLTEDRSVTEHGVQAFRKQLRGVLRGLTAASETVWYAQAAFWTVEEHQNLQTIYVRDPAILGKLVRPNLPRLVPSSDRISRLLSLPQTQIIHSAKYGASWASESDRALLGDLDAPVAFVPLMAAQRHLGTICFYGVEGGPPPQPQEHAFLSTFATIVTNTGEQWDGRFKDTVHAEMNGLLECESLDTAFRKAATLLGNALSATGCMVVFRPDPDLPNMTVASVDGLAQFLVGTPYVVGEGQTGACAKRGESIRWDDVEPNRREFDEASLKRIELALGKGKQLRSWLAVPIGAGKKNYGVVKVVNSRSASGWFSDADQRLGEDLAKRLEVVIERVQSYSHLEIAKREAVANLAQAERARREAQETAKQRQDDIIVMTHQLQAPLSSLIGSVSGVLDDGPSQSWTETASALSDVSAIIEDALALCYGTFSSFTQEAGRDISFSAEEVDGAAELRRLCQRLQQTSRRNDLTFAFKQEAGFPKLWVDRDIFTSVFYSLLHNAIKYADKHSVVTLECSVERRISSAALKVKSNGLPIDPDEREAVFEKFRRGRITKATGLRHTGVGLGLWVARQLVLAADGTISVELNELDPSLSVFVVVLPSVASRKVK